MDKKEDAASAAESSESEEGFKFSDLEILFQNPGFWCITFLCLMFYAGVFPFLKFATKLMVFKYGVDQELAGLIPAMLPFGTIFLTPFFGSIYDKYGKGATLMLAGSILLTVVHVTFALPIDNWILAIAVMIVLGIAFGLVPSAMWPSVPKIIPMKLLGTAYALIFYIQNIGLYSLQPNGEVNPVASIMITILAEMSNIERSNIQYRLNSGRQQYIDRGGKLGRRKGSVKTIEQKKEEYKEVISLLKRGYSIRNVARLTGFSIQTVQTVKNQFVNN